MSTAAATVALLRDGLGVEVAYGYLRLAVVQEALAAGLGVVDLRTGGDR